MKFVKFTENNDHEGETWVFWLQLDGNETQLKQLQSWLGTFDDDGEWYSIDMNTVLEEDKVDVLVEHGGQGYMSYHNKVTGRFTCPEVTSEDEELSDEWLASNFYKGDIARHFKSEDANNSYNDLIAQTQSTLPRSYKLKLDSETEELKLLKTNSIEIEDGSENEWVATIFDMDTFVEFLDLVRRDNHKVRLEVTNSS